MIRFNKLKYSNSFNKDIIGAAQKEKEEYDNMVIKAYEIFEEENKKKKQVDYRDNKKEFVLKYKERLENYVKDIAVKKEVSNVETMMSGLDFEKLAEQMIESEINSDETESQKSKENMDDILSSFENILSGSNIFIYLFIYLF